MLTACTHCHRRFVVSDDSKGRAARCTFCNQRFLIEPHYSEELSLHTDDDELARSLNLPTLEDIEECVQPPDVRAGSAGTQRQPVALPPLVPSPRVDYLEGQRAAAGLLLALFAGAVLAYGLWASAQAPPIAVAALAAHNITVPTDAWSRIWAPLLARAGLVVALVGPLFWGGAYIAARVIRVRYMTSGLLESCAIVTVPLTLPFLAVISFGIEDPRIIVPATVAAFPVVCLLVPALFGMPLAKGLTTASICIAVAAPAYLLVAFWGSSLQAAAVRDDDARLARLVERKKQQMAENPATAPAESRAVQLARELAGEISSERALTPNAPAVPPAAEAADVPPIPPAVVVEAPTPSIAPTAQPAETKRPEVPQISERVAELVNAPYAAPPTQTAVKPVVPLPPVTPQTSTVQKPPVPATPASLRLWREGGNPQQIIWPGVPGTSFASMHLDQFGNHVMEFWASDSLQRKGMLRLGGGSGVSYAICPAGETLLRVINGASPVAELWSLSDGSRRTQIALGAEQADARALGFFDKQVFGLISRQGNEASVDVHDGKRGAVRRRITWQTLAAGPAAASAATPENIAISPDGKCIAVVDTSARLSLLDITSGAPKKNCQLNLPRSESVDVTAIAFSPDGSLIAVLLDESHSPSRSALFCGPVQTMELSAINFGDPLWRQAGCPRTQGQRIGRAIDWLGSNELLVYGELVINATSGTILGSVHERLPGFAGAAFAQFPLPDRSFLIQPFPDGPGRPASLHRLRTDMLVTNEQW